MVEIPGTVLDIFAVISCAVPLIMMVLLIVFAACEVGEQWTMDGPRGCTGANEAGVGAAPTDEPATPLDAFLAWMREEAGGSFRVVLRAARVLWDRSCADSVASWREVFAKRSDVSRETWADVLAATRGDYRVYKGWGESVNLANRAAARKFERVLPRFRDYLRFAALSAENQKLFGHYADGRTVTTDGVDLTQVFAGDARACVMFLQGRWPGVRSQGQCSFSAWMNQQGDELRQRFTQRQLVRMWQTGRERISAPSTYGTGVTSAMAAALQSCRWESDGASDWILALRAWGRIAESDYPCVFKTNLGVVLLMRFVIDGAFARLKPHQQLSIKKAEFGWRRPPDWEPRAFDQKHFFQAMLAFWLVDVDVDPSWQSPLVRRLDSIMREDPERWLEIMLMIGLGEVHPVWGFNAVMATSNRDALMRSLRRRASLQTVFPVASQETLELKASFISKATHLWWPITTLVAVPIAWFLGARDGIVTQQLTAVC
jgi:hypothetical protein